MTNPMANPMEDPEATAAQLAALPTVVGVQVATVSSAGIRLAEAGPVDADVPDAPVTAETRFRPGSITKLLTATMVLQCVDDGLVALDDPVADHVPAVADRRITVAHLLAHSSGLDAGDVFVDTGDDDEAIARYVAEHVVGRRLLFEPGRWMSYCNGGYVLAGHLVERARDATWDAVARERVLEPLGMAATVFLTGKEAEAATDGPASARGHLAGPGGVTGVPTGTLASDPMCTRGLAPAGATLSSTAGDLARFAAAHLGVHDGPPILTPSSAARMRELWAAAPGGVTKMAGVGLAWQLWRGQAAGDPLRPRIGGANPGQSGVVAIDPVKAVGLVVLSNSDQGVNGVNLLLDGFGPAAVPDDVAPPEDLSVYAGRYRSHAMSVDVEVAGGGGLRVVVGGIEAARIGSMRMPGVIGDLTYALTAVDRTTWASPIGPIAFIDPDEAGRPRLLRWRMRAYRRVSPD